jgi:predicted Rossmann fold nucleotide-binding protein DprA/Smf involved in DNA uptake
MNTTLPLPDSARIRLGEATPPTLRIQGDRSLLNTPLLGLLCSRACPGHVILETLDRAPEWVKSNRVVISGFHSPLEQQVLRSLMRRSGRAVKVLARALDGYRAPLEEREAIAAKQLLLISSFPPNVRRTTRETALMRNRLVAALAAELVIPHATPAGALEEIVATFRAPTITQPRP